MTEINALDTKASTSPIYTIDPSLVKIPNMPSVMLLGKINHGKTEALKTIAAAGLELFVLKTEPAENLDALGPKVHTMYVPPASVPMTQMIKNFELINALSYKALANLEDIDRSAYKQMIQVANACNNFVDDRTGAPFGDVMKWGNDRAFAIDGLSGLSQMALDMIVGGKPVKGMEQYGVAMSNLEDFINYLAMNTKCFFVLTAHMELEPSFEDGATRLMPATLGKKLAPKLSKYFSDVILAQRTDAIPPKFTWATIKAGADLKYRNLPPSQELSPDFGPLITNWKNRVLAGSAAVKTA